MSLADLTEKIINDARMEADQMAKGSADEADKIIADAREELEKDREKLAREAERIAAERYQNIITLARIQSRNKVLETKQKLLDEVFSIVRKKMVELKPERFKEFALKILSRFPPEEKTLLVVGKAHKSIIDAKFVEQLNRMTADRAKEKFVLSGDGPDIQYGFYLISGDIQVDLTFESILKTIREELEMQIIGILFGKV